jgi:membrane protein DedA with SNARE-associated domain
MPLEPTLTTYGYPILYLGTILEGETFVIISAILCETGHLNVFGVMCAAFLGALSGDLLCFQLGRFGGERFLRKRSYWQRRVDKASRLLERHQDLIVFSYRFFYGLRAAIPFLIGITDYSFLRFLLISSAGALAWSVTITVAGLIFGKALLHFMGHMQNTQLLIIGGLGILGLIFWGLYHFRDQRSEDPATPDSFAATGRRQKSDGRGQMAEVGWQRSEDR